jgi:cytochrome P450
MLAPMSSGAMGSTDSRSVPLIASMTQVDDYVDCKKILLLPQAFEVSTFHDASNPIWGDIMVSSNGEWHLRRRRHVGPLLSREAIGELSSESLGRIIDGCFATCRAECTSSERDWFSADVVALSRLVTVQIAAQLVGVAGSAAEVEGARWLLSCIDGFSGAVGLRWVAGMTPEAERAVMGRACAAVDEYSKNIFQPAVARHEASASAGPVPASQSGGGRQTPVGTEDRGRGRCRAARRSRES